jgi:hypothetical protein
VTLRVVAAPYNPFARGYGQPARRRDVLPSLLPAGTYDPALDAQLGQASRGFGDLQQDAATQFGRATVDYGLGRENILRQQGYGLADLGTQESRGYQDLDTQFSRGNDTLDTQFSRGREDLDRSVGRSRQDLERQRGYEGEDYSRNVGLLQRSYDQLANRQRQGRAAMGVLSGGAALQAASKRAANQQIERQPLDTGHQRFQEGFNTEWSRLGEDYDRTRGRLGDDYDRSRRYLGEDVGTARTRLGEDTALGRQRLNEGAGADLGMLGLNYLRGTTDANQALARAGRENAQFGLDVNSQKAYQAALSGYSFDDPFRRR